MGASPKGLVEASAAPRPASGRTSVPGGGPPYFLCPFTCTRRMPVSLTHASSAALFSGFTLSHHSCWGKGRSERLRPRPPPPRLLCRGPRAPTPCAGGARSPLLANAYLVLPLGLHGSGVGPASGPFITSSLAASGSFPTPPPPKLALAPSTTPPPAGGGRIRRTCAATLR